MMSNRWNVVAFSVPTIDVMLFEQTAIQLEVLATVFSQPPIHVICGAKVQQLRLTAGTTFLTASFVVARLQIQLNVSGDG